MAERGLSDSGAGVARYVIAVALIDAARSTHKGE
jgi:hypothetical protein